MVMGTDSDHVSFLGAPFFRQFAVSYNYETNFTMYDQKSPQNVPDRPVNLTNDPNYNFYNSIGLTWDDGAYDGGSPVIDYLLWITQGNASFAVKDWYNTSQVYVTGLEEGTTYRFKV